MNLYRDCHTTDIECKKKTCGQSGWYVGGSQPPAGFFRPDWLPPNKDPSPQAVCFNCELQCAS